ncbi:MAG: ATP-grasp protein [Bacteroidota bacterium]|nr:ATP-grasp protein [Bacteroidota bacterium]
MSKKSNCPYCGDSPINHTLAYVGQTCGVFLDPLISLIAGTSNGLFSKILVIFNRVFISYSLFIGVLKFNKDVNRANTGRSKVIWEEANRRGIEMEQLVIYGKPIEQYRAKIKNNKWFYFESLPIPPNLPQDSYNYIDDKIQLKKVLDKSGIPVPKSISVKNKQQTIDAFNSLIKPVIVKPRVGSRGRHTTVFINTESELIHAFNIAQKLCKYVAIEEYLVGPVCRATLVDGKLVGFFIGRAPVIIGNGENTITELIEEKNKNRNERIDKIIINNEHVEYLARQGYSMTSIPESDKKIQVLSRTGRFFGGETEEFLPHVHPKLITILEKAVSVINVPIVGFDVIIENPGEDPDKEHWGIIEANSLPFIDLHYFPLYGDPVNIASYIWDLWK